MPPIRKFEEWILAYTVPHNLRKLQILIPNFNAVGNVYLRMFNMRETSGRRQFKLFTD